MYTQLYYLTPASFWNGNAKVNLRIEFPEGRPVAVHSNIPLEKGKENVFTATLDGVPNNEWTFSYVDTKGLIFGTNDLRRHDMMVFVITALLLTAAPVSRRYSKRPLSPALPPCPAWPSSLPP